AAESAWMQRQNLALRGDAVSEGRLTYALSSILLEGGTSGIHVATKILIIHNLAQAAFAESEESAEIARQNWTRLAAQVDKREWFKTNVLNTHRAEIKQLTEEWPANRESVAAMLKVSRFLRDAIRGTTRESPYLDQLQKSQVKALWYSQAMKAADEL